MLRGLASRIPDVPAWVELRGILLSGRGETVGTPGPGPADFIVRGTDFGLFTVSGAPDLAPLPSALERHAGRAVLGAADQTPRIAAAIPRWAASRAFVHTLADPSASRLRPATGATVGMLSSRDAASLDSLPPVLRDEVRAALGFTHVAAVFVGGRPVSFGYAGYETEKFWDVSIDTLEEHRGRGYARDCCEFLIDHMARHGLEPVWGALERNAASRALAASLGFRPVGEVVVFEPPAA